MRIRVGDDIYPFNLEQILISEAREIKRNTGGLTLMQFINGCMELDPDALQAAAWLAKTRAGEAVRFEDLESINAFDIEVMEDEPEKAEDPTTVTFEDPAGTSTATPSGTSTSPRSRSGGISRPKSSTG